jgi:tripartite-type tricarboxylate transporter receptor subunit TctC
MLHVPYKGAAPLMTDLMGGQIDMVFIPLAGSTPAMISEGKVKALGLTTKTPHPRFPNIPALAAQKGLEGFEFDLWAGIEVPKNTPADVTARLNKAIYEALQNADIRKAYEATGNTVAKPMSPEELARVYNSETARYQAIAKSINLQPQ